MSISNVVPDASYHASSELHSHMKSASHVIYDFIPSDDRLLKNDGFCVIDQIVGIYGRQFENEPIIKGRKILRLTREYVIECFYRIVQELIHPLDRGIDDDEDTWKLEDGITPKMLHVFLRELNISYYAFDITRNCFDKYVSTCCNYKTMVYYCVNNHMYWVNDPAAAISLVRQAADVETRISSMVLETQEIKNQLIK